METGQPSRTASSAARYRAAHQVLEHGRIFTDPLAWPILGMSEDEVLADARERRGMRLFVAARSRFAEDALATAVRERGIERLVLLGAGLDTFAYRNPHPGLRVIEVDHPDTQAWKRRRLAEAGIGVPEGVTYLGVDFENESLGERLRLDGPAFFFWLGVAPYLTSSAFGETLAVIASGAGHEVVFDYAMAPERASGERRAALEARAERVAGIGEPWLTYFDPPQIAAQLTGLGFTDLEDLGPAELAARFFGRPDVPPGTAGGHFIAARRAAR
jgi:methyltransferase (TIGR00027 family)